MLNFFDQIIVDVDRALRTLAGTQPAMRPMPRASQSGGAGESVLGEGEKRHAAALMRVNHVGEVCAQALYHAQGQSTSNATLREHFAEAARDETDHLAWTRERLFELGGRPSLLNPIWYAGAYLLGRVAGRAGDALSLGFVVETEAQVERHLNGHLSSLPPADLASRVVVEQMSADEARHGANAMADGAQLLPWPARVAMRGAAKVMTTVAYWV